MKQTVYSLQASIARHQWVCGLDAQSPDEQLEAARLDFIEQGGAFAARSGVEAYGAWVMKLGGRRNTLNLSISSGSGDWWFEALDRKKGLALLENWAVRASIEFDYLPDRAPLGLDYQDLHDGLMRMAGFESQRERGQERRTGGRSAAHMAQIWNYVTSQ